MTELLTPEAELDSARRLSFAMEEAVGGIAILDREGRYTFVNHAYSSMAGYKPVEMIGLNWEVTVYEADVEMLQEAYGEMLRAGKVTRRGRWKNKDGKVFHKEVTMVANVERGEFCGHFCFSRDLTDEVERETKLRRSEELLLKAGTMAGVGYWHVDLVKNSLYWSDEVYRIHGLRAEEYVPELGSAIEFYHPDDRGFVRNEINTAIEDKCGFEFELRILRGDGNVRYVHSRGDVELDKLGGEVVGLCGVFQDITDRKMSEMRRDMAREFLNATLNNIPDLVFVKDRDSKIIESNESFCSFMGIDRDGMLGKTLFEKFPKEQADHFYEQDRKAFRDGYTESYQYVSGAGEKVIYGFSRKIRFEDGKGNEYLLAIVRDITKEHEQEQEIAYSKQFLKTVIDELPDMVFVKDEHLRLQLANKAFLEMYDKDENDILGTTTLEDFPEEQVKLFTEQDRIALSSGLTEVVEEISGPAAPKKMLHTRKVGFDDHKGERFLLGIARDVTEKVKSEKFLDQIYKISTQAGFKMEMRLDAILKSANEYFGLDFGIVSKIEGDTYRVEHVDSPGGEISAGQEFDFNGTYCVHVYEGDSVVSFNHVGESEIREHPCYKNFALESYIGAPLVVKGKRYGTVNFSSANRREPFSDLEESFVQMIAHWVSNEIERGIDEGRLRDYADELRRSNEELDDFAYVASHDLKEPLRGMYMYAEFLVEDYEGQLEDDAIVKLKRIGELGKRMEGMLITLLGYAKIGNSELKREWVDSREVVDHVLEGLPHVVEDPAVEFVFKGEWEQIYCERKYIEKIFQNLVSNAVKYNGKDEVRIEIGCNGGHERVPGHVVFYVWDNGIGIPESKQGEVFKIFNRLNKRDKYGEGSGSGLTILKKMVEKHGGQVWLESEEGLGTIFYFSIPRGE